MVVWTARDIALGSLNRGQLFRTLSPQCNTCDTWKCTFPFCSWKCSIFEISQYNSMSWRSTSGRKVSEVLGPFTSLKLNVESSYVYYWTVRWKPRFLSLQRYLGWLLNDKWGQQFYHSTFTSGQDSREDPIYKHRIYQSYHNFRSVMSKVVNSYKWKSLKSE